MPLPLPREASRLLSRLAGLLAQRGAEGYVVGGFLRDLLLGRPSQDIDLAIGASPAIVGPELAQALGGRFFILSRDEDMGRLVVPVGEGASLTVDLHPLSGDIEEDLRRRDYTVDALAAPLDPLARGEAVILDPCGGQRDLAARLVRLVSVSALRDDPLRLLRGVRLAVELDFQLEPATARAIAEHAHLLPLTAPERQRDELVRLLASHRTARGLRLLESLGLLSSLLPEVASGRGVSQPREHYWDVLGHALSTVEALDLLLAPVPPSASEGSPWQPREPALWSSLWGELGPLATSLRSYLDEKMVAGRPRQALLKLGGLLHDVAKPATRSVDASGRLRFFGHDRLGGEQARGIMARLRFSGREEDFVGHLVRAHLRPTQMAQQGPPTPRAIYRFYRDCGEAAWGVLLLSLADHLATVGPRLDWQGWRWHVGLVLHVLQEPERRRELRQPPRLVTGHDLMEALGLRPGPTVGALLEALREAQATGKVKTREEALALARRLLERMKVAAGGGP